MRLYEVMVIFHPGLEAEAVRAATDRLGSVITERGGTVTRVDNWGRRRFAYEVKHLKDGHYVVVELMATPEAVAELDRVASITDEVVRHKIVRLPDSGIPHLVPGSYEEAAAAADRQLTPAGRKAERDER